jgi:flavin-dependent dehydrogenase
LGRAGFRVLLCDKASFPRPKICGETVNPRCWDAFDALGVADEVERRIHNRIAAISVTNKEGREVRVEVGNGEGRCFFSMGRDVLDHILVRSAETTGVEFHDGTTVTRVAWEGCWRIEVRDGKSGEKSSVTAGYLIGADGRNSTIASHLAARREISERGTNPSGDSDRVGVQWHAALRPEIAGALYMYLFDAGYCGLVAVDGRHTNVSMVTRPELASLATADFRSFLEKTLWSNPVAAARFLDLNPVGKIVKTSPINPRRNPFDQPHAALIGDASQTVEPFTGEGIRYALEDGIAAARRLVGERDGTNAGAAGTNSRFRVNRVFSPVLRNPRMRDGLISLGARFPFLSRWVAGTVIPRGGRQTA